ncbi:hypothetical protein LLE49_15285 [Alicyclobacillus tolerans]|nr:hypothetical protein [Alicyclobacillus tolerans]
MSKNYHCCATCQHFHVFKDSSGVHTECLRLGYATKPQYQFRCWNPRPDIVERMRRSDQDGTSTSKKSSANSVF